ncbi:hypothetical protein [Candidatus Palauibacter sp.]|uniref:hypothetical protein n=1 Tax=Candidatus Palauibacter sp. TaxID=3101350 RepID=UPI003B5302E6
MDHAEHDDLVQRPGSLAGSRRLGRGRGRQGGRHQLDQRAGNFVGHEHALAVRVRAEDDGLLPDLQPLHDGAGLEVDDGNGVAARVVDERVATIAGDDDRKRPGAEALRDAARDRERRRIDEGHLVRSAAGDDVGDLIGGERAPGRAGTPLDGGVQFPVQEVDDGDCARIEVRHEGMGPVPHHIRGIGAIARGMERPRRPLARVHRPQPVGELGRDPGLSAYRPGREQRWARPDAPHGAGDDPALVVEPDERRIAELAHEPAALDTD